MLEDVHNKTVELVRLMRRFYAAERNGEDFEQQKSDFMQMYDAGILPENHSWKPFRKAYLRLVETGAASPVAVDDGIKSYLTVTHASYHELAHTRITLFWATIDLPKTKTEDSESANESLSTFELETKLKQEFALVEDLGDSISSIATNPQQKEAKDEWTIRAIQTLRNNPDWSDAEVARTIGRHPGTLSRNQDYQIFAKSIRSGVGGDIRRGTKYDGQTDAEYIEDFDIE